LDEGANSPVVPFFVNTSKYGLVPNHREYTLQVLYLAPLRSIKPPFLPLGCTEVVVTASLGRSKQSAATRNEFTEPGGGGRRADRAPLTTAVLDVEGRDADCLLLM
jgi:hypothetical protein